MHENILKSDKRMPYRQQPYLIMHVAMNRVDPVVVHYLQMSLHAISLRKYVLIEQACVAEMAVRYAALCACRKVHVCHCNSLGGAT